MTLSDTSLEQWQSNLVNNTLLDSAVQVLSGSDYIAQWGQIHPGRAKDLIDSGDISNAYTDDEYQQHLITVLEDVTDEIMLHQQLRHFRQREMVRIIWRDLAGWTDLAETVRDLSALADACIQQSLNILHQWQCNEFGIPCNINGEQQYLIVLGMGKLGAGELNLSSDIDLIFVYPEDGEAQDGAKNLSNIEFFTRLGQKLIQSLDNVTIDGFVFRVDMRLRPFGESGALVSSFAAMEDYYQTQGREWERYAMIKARAITGIEADISTLMHLLRPFVYRRYFDYGVFDALREMKSMIAAQLHRKGMEDNIKLGAGGIREIEFIGQVFQLIHGGRDKSLQQRPILTILDLLVERNFLPKATVRELKLAYDFLRRTEHRIQAWADQQTHSLPEDVDGQERIATLMGFSNRNQFSLALKDHRQQVQNHFEQILTIPQAEEDSSSGSVSLFDADNDEKLHYLQNLGYEDTQNCLDQLDGIFNSHNYKNLSQTSHDRLEKLLPLLVQAAANVENPDVCLARLMPLLESILQRSAYMSLLVENSLALSQLIKLCAASPWISHQLARYPMLLDELLDPRHLYDIPDRQRQKENLVKCLAVAGETDLERQMDLLREFRQIASLHVAAADITDGLPLMRVGDQLSELAEIQLEQVMKLAWHHLVTRHGRPPCTQTDDLNQCGFTVLAYGKLGGLELGYGSDLDLVFVFDDANQGVTDGDKPLDALLFYTRLAQRMIHLMDTVTSSGILYEIDMRLRPNGNSGLLVTVVSGFSEYQNNDAWTWEHQALVRARCVAGDQNLAKQIVEIRQQVLAAKRDQQTLIAEVRDMRAKMREQLDKSTPQVFDLKQGEGGITDIEFMVQYAVLAWSETLPELLNYTDNIRILDALRLTGKLSEEDSDMLAGAYRYYRDLANHCVLQETPAVVAVAEVAVYRPQVKAIWQRWFE